MNSSVSRELVDKIIASADIAAIIGEYVKLEKKGNDYKGLCPFHNDTKPSFSVSPKRNVYKCFSCNQSGNLVTFLMNHLKISFIEALKIIASKSGIELNIYESPQAIRNRKFLTIMEEATKTYEFYLHNTIDGKAAIEYLNNRKIDIDVIRHFRIGLSSNDSILVKTLIDSNRFLPLDLKELSLINNDGLRNYDLFRNRIIFPIEDLRGNVIAFNGRIYNKESISKYINSSENAIFKKGSTIYNYYRALSEIKAKNCVFVFEGGMDVIAAYRCGVLNAVATMGTSITDDQVKIITDVTKNVILCYDGDTAGINATKRAILMFAKAQVNIKVVVLEENIDPDEYINKYGNDALKDLLTEKPVTSVDYLYTILKRNLNINDINSITNFCNEIKNLGIEFKSKIIQNYLFEKASKDLKMPKEDLINSANSFTQKDYNQTIDYDYSYTEKESIIDYQEPIECYNETELNNTITDFDNYNDYTVERKNINNYKKEKYRKAEDNILFLAFQSREKCQIIRKKLAIDEFVDKINRNILFKLYDYYDLVDIMEPNDFYSKLESFEMDRLNLIINNNDIIIKEKKDEKKFFVDNLSNNIDDLIEVIKKSKYQKKVDDIKANLENKPIDHSTLIEHIETKKRTINIKKK